MLVLRTCNASLRSYGGFQWPESGLVEAPDWNHQPHCGNGLHGLPWGEGNGGLLNWSDDAKWLVVEVDDADVVMIGSDKCKFPRGVVVFCGNREGATTYLAANGGAGKAIVGGTATAGDSGTATAGNFGTATAGNFGTATAGYRGTATAGNFGTATAGNFGTATAGYRGTATAGDSGTATAGYRGTATAGYRGTATAGDSGTATAGYRGTATAGYRGTATAGYRGTICIAYWDNLKDRRRIKIGYIGEDGLKANEQYRLNDRFEFVPVNPSAMDATAATNDAPAKKSPAKKALAKKSAKKKAAKKSAKRSAAKS